MVLHPRSRSSQIYLRLENWYGIEGGFYELLLVIYLHMNELRDMNMLFGFGFDSSLCVDVVCKCFICFICNGRLACMEDLKVNGFDLFLFPSYMC